MRTKFGGVRGEKGDPVAGLDAASNRPRKGRDLLAELSVGEGSFVLDDRDPVWKDRGGALQEAQGTQRRLVRGGMWG